MKSLSRVRLFATLWTVAHQVPPSMGFSRQEYWSGLPCPSPGDFPNSGTEPRSSTLQADSLPSELPGKPKNTGVGSLSLLQGIFLTQELNQGFLHCRQILYQIAKWQPTLVFLPGKYYGQGNLVGCNPWVHGVAKELDTT